MKLYNYILILLVCFAISSCKTNKLPDDVLEFSGTNIDYVDSENFTNKSRLKNQISGVVLRDKTEFDNSKVKLSENRIKSTLYSKGYFSSNVDCDSIQQKREKVEIDCEITLGPRYTIDSVFAMQDTMNVVRTLKGIYGIEFTKKGDYYDVDNLTADRTAFVTASHNNGFPFVTNQDIVFYVDTISEEHKVDVHMIMKSTKDSLKFERYSNGNIYINPNFSLKTDKAISTEDMVRENEFFLKSGYDFLTLPALEKAVYLEEGRIYDESRNKITSDRLLDFGIFKFVNMKTVLREGNKIDHFINLTTLPMKSVSGQLDLNNRQGNFLGLSGQVAYTHRNLFNGAQRFDLTLSGGIENQLGQDQTLINTSDIELEAKLSMPNVILPFASFKTNRNHIPRTTMSIAASQQDRVNFYTLRALEAGYGFRWNETDNKESYFKPVDLSWVVLSQTSTEFEDFLALNPRQAESFRTTLLLASSYEYTFTKKDKYNPFSQSYFKGTVESAGNLLALAIGNNNDPNNPTTLFNTPYSQYVRFTTDSRKYWGSDKLAIASRLIVGAGVAYGNSNELPYAKQFSVGGANSLRAFRLRTVGPGRFSPTVIDNNQFIDQTGDLKIEANIEARFPLVSYLKGAIFIDAGNVWLLNNDNIPEGNFTIGEFYNQFAIGTGFGFRFDIELFVVRFDLGVPIRQLGSSGVFEWTFDEIELLNSDWLRNNVIPNLTVGYPF